MTKLFKRILPCMIIVLLIFTFASCKKNEETYKYPSEYPHLTTNAETPFVKIGNLTVTNKDVYDRLAQSYGVDEINLLMDASILADVTLTAEQQKEISDELDYQMYGDDKEALTAEEKAEKEAAYEIQVLSNGLHYTAEGENDLLYYVNYYTLQYKRHLQALNEFKDEIKAKDESEEGPYFNDDAYVSFFATNYHKTYKAIIATFASEVEAKAAMEAAGINTTNLVAGWTTDGTTVMSSADALTKMNAIYQAAYGVACEGAKDYTYADLLAIKASATQDGAIATKATKLNAGEYTFAPVAYGTRCFIMYMAEVGSEYVNDAEDTKKFGADKVSVKADNSITELNEEVKTAIYEDVVLNALTADQSQYQARIDKAMFALRQEKGLKIFDEGIKITYKAKYEEAYSTLSITDYPAFAVNNEVSSTVVASWNGGQITVDQFFDHLAKRYGAMLTLLFMQQYTVLNSKHNTVINYATGEILDQTKYNEYVTKDVNEYKEAFEEGNFEASGYPASYGWENFLRDYIGLSSEKAIITDFDSTLYNDVLALYKKALYTVETSDLSVTVNGDYYYVHSDKWDHDHVTELKVADCKAAPVAKVIYTSDDLPSKDENGDLISYEKKDYYGHIVLTYTDNEDNVKTVLTKMTADMAIQEIYDDLYNKAFSATVYGIYTYYDADNDGVEDDIAEDAAKQAKATELVDALWAAAKTYHEKDHETTLSNAFTYVKRVYDTSTTTYLAYKQAGLRVGFVSGATLSGSATTYPEAVKDEIKTAWTKVNEYEYNGNKVSSVMTQNLDANYRFVQGSGAEAQVVVLTPYDFDTTTVFAENKAYHCVLTSAKSKTAIEYSSSTTTQRPDLYLYEQYQLESNEREVTIYCSTQITTYYVPALNEVASDEIVTKSLMTLCKDLLKDTSFASAYTSEEAIVSKLIDKALEEK